MKKCLLRLFSCLLLLCVQSAIAQKDYSAIDRYAKKAPPGISRLYKPLTHYLTDRYSSDDEKARSIAVWIMNNIRYDTKVYRTDKRKKLSPDRILNKRKAICQGYCDLFEAMCTEAGLTARTVVGYDKGGEYEPTDIFVRDDHAWSAVNIDGKWQLLDLTWGAGYVVPKRQLFRRLLYLAFDVPFKQKYRFIKHIDFGYFFTNPDTFAIDHLPAHPWWQLTAEKSIKEYEKDTTVRSRPAPVVYSDGASGSIPDIDNSEAPVAYLKKAQAAFKFNPKNYRILAEGKAMYSSKWFVQTRKDKGMEDKKKVEVYDSCKTVVDEAKDAVKMYIHYTSEERNLRKIKNKEYQKEATGFNKDQKHRIAAETQKSTATINNIDRQIAKIKAENKNLRNELSDMNRIKIPKRARKPERIVSKNQLNAYSKIFLDSVILLQNTIDTLVAKNENGHFVTLDKNEGNIDSLIWFNCSLIYKKAIRRVFFFDWNYKQAVDTLQYRHFAVTNKKDSLFTAETNLLKNIAESEQQQADLVAQTRAKYVQQLKFYYTLYATCTDSILTELKLKDSCRDVKVAWREYNNDRMVQNDREIQRLKSKKRSITMLRRELRTEKRYNNGEIYFEGKRYKYFNRKYFQFYKREKKKAVEYYKNLSKLKKAIQVTDTECKKRIKDEERKEKEAAEKAK
jgi:hypothetical protein